LTASSRTRAMFVRRGGSSDLNTLPMT
jgi:hypothetical protein